MIYVDLDVHLRCGAAGCKLAVNATCEFRVEGHGHLRLVRPRELPAGWKILRRVPGVLNNTRAEFRAFCPLHASSYEPGAEEVD